ncbi:MAG: response regulator [Gammaproteobacteria bacterium]|nr:response regulator [Gammaproteobacteria bacterium]
MSEFAKSMFRVRGARHARLLLVDDEPGALDLLRRAFAAEPYLIESYTDPTEALARAKQIEFDLVISDYRMPEVDGVSFLTIFRTLQPDAVRLILSGYADSDALLGAINDARIFRFISKPWMDSELRATVFQALAYRATLVENRELAERARFGAQECPRRQQQELERLEREQPGITRVRRGADGAILIGNEEDDEQ